MGDHLCTQNRNKSLFTQGLYNHITDPSALPTNTNQLWISFPILKKNCIANYTLSPLYYFIHYPLTTSNSASFALPQCIIHNHTDLQHPYIYPPSPPPTQCDHVTTHMTHMPHRTTHPWGLTTQNRLLRNHCAHPLPPYLTTWPSTRPPIHDDWPLRIDYYTTTVLTTPWPLTTQNR